MNERDKNGQLILVIGGSGSGKSAFAEELVRKLPDANRYYLATMQVYGEEGKQKVKRHQELRRGKSFITIEQPKDIGLAKAMIKEQDSVVLLECMSNLVANEMFLEYENKRAKEVVDKIWSDLMELLEQVNTLVVVSNNVFEDGNSYDPTTVEYMRALGWINQKLTEYARCAYELVVGIAVPIKE